MTSPTTTIFFISNPHAAEHHSKEKDKSVFLSYEGKNFVKKAVKISPMQFAGGLLLNVQVFKILTTPSNSPSRT